MGETTTIPRNIQIPKNSNNGIANNNIAPIEQQNIINQALSPDTVLNQVLPSEFEQGFALPNTPKVISGDH